MLDAESLKKWEKLYLEVAFHIDKYLREKYDTPFVESYYGPSRFKELIDQKANLPLSKLDIKCKELLALVEQSKLGEPRNLYLQKQITAMQTSIDVLSGQKLEYLEEVNRYFNITPEVVDDYLFEDAIHKLNDIMSPEQLIAYRKTQTIPKEKVIHVASLIMKNLQEQVRKKIKLPMSENFEIEGVVNQPWGAYNWYLGDYTSKVELNLDINFHLFSLLYLIAHEGYTGHHLDHCLKEKLFFKEKGYIEHGIILTRVPESVIGEGIAEIGIHVLFHEKELYEWVSDTIAPHLGLTIDPELEYRLYQAGNILRYVRDNCALLLHVKKKKFEDIATYYAKFLRLTEEEATKALRFITHPYWKIYAFNYGEGLKLMKTHLGEPPSFEKFVKILTSQILPSQLK